MRLSRSRIEKLERITSRNEQRQMICLLWDDGRITHDGAVYDNIEAFRETVGAKLQILLVRVYSEQDPLFRFLSTLERPRPLMVSA